MKNYKKLRLSVQNKLFMIVFFTIVLPMIIAGTVMINQQRKMIRDEAVRAAQKDINQISDIMSNELNHLKSISNLFYLDSEIISLLRAENDLISDDGFATTMNTALDSYNASMARIDFKTVLLSKNDRIYGSAPNIQKMHAYSYKNTRWYQSLEVNPSRIIWTSDRSLDFIFSLNSMTHMYLIREIHDPETWKSLGTLILGISENEIRKMYSGYITNQQSIFLVDDENRVISYENNLKITTAVEMLEPYLYQVSGYQLTKALDKDLLMSHYTINTNKWKLYTFNDMAYLTFHLTKANQSYIFTLIVFFIVSTIFSLLFIRKFFYPLKTLNDTMKTVEKGNLEVEAPVLHDDEIGDLSLQFNSMIHHVKDLMSEIMEVQELKRKAEIQSLQTQINPHFLYNTFATIRYLIYTEKKEDVDKIILSFIKIMKNILSDTKELISIEREIDLLKDYVYIQNYAFSNKVQVQYNIDERIKSFQTIKLLLQPIIENAFLHGLKPKKENGILIINGFIQDQKVIFEVIDNGIGFDTSIDFSKTPSDSTRIGYRNVQDRIELTFGSPYGASIESKQNEGTRVTLKLPIIEQKEVIIYDENTTG
ncbi:sensor histidine kinase [Proteiniclasticum ruminis]|uniref:HAMP domain-containing protein n=1 Tax=Proteiniclasticum ruminis TaxID=398199 RepID=A0A1G8JTH4_9CLOT|nr:sensor histidine kinase [Proteiniclasticum ruminis]SDI34504.1 HAMP domain-containing protein [Proteiniclasticum ruminis]